MRINKFFATSILSLALTIASAVVAAAIGNSDKDGHPLWNNFGWSVAITVVITIPAMSVFIASLIAGLLRAFRQKGSQK